MGEVIDLEEYRRKAARRKQRRERARSGDKAPRRGRDSGSAATSEPDDKGPEKTPKR